MTYLDPDISLDVVFFVFFFHSNLFSSYPTVLRIERHFRRNAIDFHLEGPEKQDFINIASSNFHKNGLCKQRLGQYIYIPQVLIE